MKERYGEIAKQILAVVGVAGIVIVAAAAPGALLATKFLIKKIKDSLVKNIKKSFTNTKAP